MSKAHGRFVRPGQVKIKIFVGKQTLGAGARRCSLTRTGNKGRVIDASKICFGGGGVVIPPHLPMCIYGQGVSLSFSAELRKFSKKKKAVPTFFLRIYK